MILFLLRSYCTDRLTDQRSAMHMELNNLNSVDIVRHLSVNRDYRLNRSTRIPAPFEQTPISQTNCPRAFIVLYNIVRAVDFFPPLLFIFIFIYFFLSLTFHLRPRPCVYAFRTFFPDRSTEGKKNYTLYTYIKRIQCTLLRIRSAHTAVPEGPRGRNHFLFGRISSEIKDNDCGLFAGNLITQVGFLRRARTCGEKNNAARARRWRYSFGRGRGVDIHPLTAPRLPAPNGPGVARRVMYTNFHYSYNDKDFVRREPRLSIRLCTHTCVSVCVSIYILYIIRA